jgi:hypothetical protein
MFVNPVFVDVGSSLYKTSLWRRNLIENGKSEIGISR